MRCIVVAYSPLHLYGVFLVDSVLVITTTFPVQSSLHAIHRTAASSTQPSDVAPLPLSSPTPPLLSLSLSPPPLPPRPLLLPRVQSPPLAPSLSSSLSRRFLGQRRRREREHAARLRYEQVGVHPILTAEECQVVTHDTRARSPFIKRDETHPAPVPLTRRRYVELTNHYKCNKPPYSAMTSRGDEALGRRCTCLQ